MNKEEQLLIRLTSEEKGKLKSMAKRENTTMAKLIKSRVFGTDHPDIQKDLKGELKEINQKLFLLLGNATKGNENQEKIIELLGMLNHLDQPAATEGEANIFDFLIDHIQEKYVGEYNQYLSGDQESHLYEHENRFAKREFEKFIRTLAKMKKGAYPNA